MPFNGTGTFVPLSFPDYPAQSGTLIKSSQFNNNIDDLINGLSNTITRDGQSPPTANLPMAGKKHTGVAAATATDDYARFDQVVPVVGGTITANTATPALKITQAGAGAVILVEDVASDTTPFIVTATGLVGVQEDVPRAPLSIGDSLDLFYGAAGTPTVPSIRADAMKLYLNAFGAGKVQFNFDTGTGGVDFCDGAGATKLSVSSAGYMSFAAVDAVKLPVGTTAQRPGSPVLGDARINSTLSKPEWWNGTFWSAMGGGATGGSGDDVFYENAATVTQDYTITTNKNAGTFGPVTIAAGKTVTVPSGSVWSIV